MFAFKPEGGSSDNLIDLSRIPIGIPVLGFAERSNLKLGLPDPVF